jgi:hypothetical protein
MSYTPQPKTMNKIKERRHDLYEIVVTTGQRFKVKEDLRTLTKDINNAKSNSYGLIKITTDAYEGFDDWDPIDGNNEIPNKFLIEDNVYINPDFIVFIFPII